MGNAATKEAEGPRRGRGLSTGSGSLTGANVALPFAPPAAIAKKLKKDREKQKQREEHAWNLVVRYEETVDGGYLAPYGTYRSNLDYRTDVVRGLIVERKLAPFYTPLQDFDESWTDGELLAVLDVLQLHAEMPEEDSDLEEDMDIHKIRRSSHSLRKLENKRSREKVKAKMVKWQSSAQQRYDHDRTTKRSPFLPSRDLQLKLYRDAQECPICFVYYPPYLNISRCCIQPICSECFVQIKRLDPHPPHDEEGNETDTENPEALISESAKCPFCAMPDFGVTYYPPGFRTGVGGVYPSSYRTNETTTIAEEDGVGAGVVSTSIGDAIGRSRSAMGTPPKPVVMGDAAELAGPEPQPAAEGGERVNRRRQGSLPATGPGVITADAIRPDWVVKLKNARLRLVRRSAAASAIHATSLIYEHNDLSGSSVRNGYDTGDSPRRSRSETLELEERMIEEALRLSLMEQDEEDGQNGGAVSRTVAARQRGTRARTGQPS